MAGVISRGVQGPIIREGDDIVDIVVKSVYASEAEDNYSLKNRDIIAVTESVVARAQGNYATVDQVAADVARQVPRQEAGPGLPHPQPQPLLHVPQGHGPRHGRGGHPASATPTTRWATPSSRALRLCEGTVTAACTTSRKPLSSTALRLPRPPLHGRELPGLLPSGSSRPRAQRPTFVFSNDCRYIAQFCDQNPLLRHPHPQRAPSDTLAAMPGEDRLHPGRRDGLPRGRQRLPRPVRPARLQQGHRGKAQALPPQLPARGGRHPGPHPEGSAASRWRSWSTATVPLRTPSASIWELADPVVSPAYTAGLAGKPNELKLKFLAGQRLCRPLRRRAQGRHPEGDQVQAPRPGGQHEQRGHHPPPATPTCSAPCAT